MTGRRRRWIRRWGYRLGLIRYCIHCDGSINEARQRGRRFRTDRWIGHRQHERYMPQGPARYDLPRIDECEACGALMDSPACCRSRHREDQVERDNGPDHPIGAGALVSDVDVDDPDVIRQYRNMSEEGSV